MAKTKVDAGLFSSIKSHCTELEQNHAARVTMCNEIEKMFMMTWDDEKPDTTGKDWIKLTISPEARNKALGAIRLMTATDPKFSVPFDKNNQEGKESSSLLEKAAAAMWSMSGRIRQNPVNYDAVTSAVLFGEMHIGVNSTADLLEHAKGGSKASQMRFEKIATLTPYMFEVYDPRTGFPEFDNYGLSSYYRKVKMKSGAVLDEWGELAKIAGLSENKRNEDVQYCDYWDNEYHAVWIEGSGAAILFAPHNLPCIPIVAQVTDGSAIHEKEESKRQPFLYNLWKSGLWKRQNLSLTVIYSTMFALASNPTFIEKVASDEREIKADYSVPGGKIKMLANEDFHALQKNIIDPSIQQGMDIAQKMIDESTIYGQTLGEPLGSNAPFSMVALLNQAGRLPLVTIQRRGSWAIAKAVELAFTMMKDRGGKNKMQDKTKLMELSAKDIPDNLIIEANLDIELPQDKRGTMQVALQGVQTKLFSKEYGRREIGIEQSDEMTKEIWAEDLADLEMQKEYQIQLAKVQQEIQAGAQQQQAQTMQGQNPQTVQQQQVLPQNINSQMQQQMPPDMMAQQGVSENMPMTEPVMPEGL
jgi:hypothetical protein